MSESKFAEAGKHLKDAGKNIIEGLKENSGSIVGSGKRVATSSATALKIVGKSAGNILHHIRNATENLDEKLENADKKLDEMARNGRKLGKQDYDAIIDSIVQTGTSIKEKFSRDDEELTITNRLKDFVGIKAEE